MTLLTDLVFEDGFKWHLVYEEALVQVKKLANKILVLRSISYTSREPIFLFTDASKIGVGVWVG
jgi:hypothetical protein